MARALNTKLVETAKPDPARRIEIADGALAGLYLVVQPSGAKSWAVRYRHDGKPAEADARPLPSPAAWRGARGCAGGPAASSPRARTPPPTK